MYPRLSEAEMDKLAQNVLQGQEIDKQHLAKQQPPERVSNNPSNPDWD